MGSEMCIRDRNNERASICKKVSGSHLVVIGENKKMLIFPLNELPLMTRGKGVRLQKYREENILFLQTFDPEEGLIIEDSSGRKRVFNNIGDWTGKRAQAGRLVPKGFPKLTN